MKRCALGLVLVSVLTIAVLAGDASAFRLGVADTSAMSGRFRDDARTRSEFLGFLRENHR